MSAELRLELHGLAGRITVTPSALIDSVRSRLLPPWQELEPTSGLAEENDASPSLDFDLSITDLGTGRYRLRSAEDELALGTLDQVRSRLVAYLGYEVATRSPEKIFLHAGVVGMQGRAILIPGISYSGKTSLVVSLVQAGADYFSDEYAVVDHEGLIHPFLKPLSIRDEGDVAREHAVETLGGGPARSPLPAGLVVLSRYRDGASWAPSRLSDAEAVLALLNHTPQARLRSADALEALKNLVDGATVLRGDRGEASEIVPALVTALSESIS